MLCFLGLLIGSGLRFGFRTVAVILLRAPFPLVVVASGFFLLFKYVLPCGLVPVYLAWRSAVLCSYCPGLSWTEGSVCWFVCDLLLAFPSATISTSPATPVDWRRLHGSRSSSLFSPLTALLFRSQLVSCCLSRCHILFLLALPLGFLLSAFYFLRPAAVSTLPGRFVHALLRHMASPHPYSPPTTYRLVVQQYTQHAGALPDA